MDGRTQSSEADEFVYHEALVQPALTSLAQPKSVFIAGGGEGATLREALSHKTVERVVMVDLDREVVDLCREHLPNHHQGAFQDPRLTLIHEDAGRYLEEDTARYDLIIIDIPDPLEGGPAYLLYTDEFYGVARQRLNEGGLLVVQSGPCGPLNYQEVFTAIHQSLAMAAQVSGTTSGIRMAIVPQLVPVAKAVSAASRNTSVGRTPAGRESPRSAIR